MIPIVRETPGIGPLEHCVFCGAKTPMWHVETNTPVCKPCAGKHDVGELDKLKGGVE